ncbi:hypothetical protein Slin15195_G073130 [Septoria linicola]|uniref:Zn(2)-C6 fungal-type domain-containing protein n=1 Tax=Septoria linicola TaxID=215465 RepID=A0A9Q9ASS3_9PEZI|nr:hypothetical protein Slin15195_G073130 [Septoria linicola]
MQDQESLAPQACISCRKQKRKCDKALPGCGLCLRFGRTCDYSISDQPSAPSAEDFAALQQKVADLEGLLTGSSSGSNNSNGSDTVNGLSSFPSNKNSPTHVLQALSPPTDQSRTWPAVSTFPSLFFLDSDVFDYERFQINSPFVKVPPGALSVLGNSAQLRTMIEQYFITVHTYFPIVSKIRLYQHLANPAHAPGADIALLFLAMKLIISELPDGMPPQTQLYADVKSFFSYVESQNGFSIQMMQALLLISLYELGHAIYPACYLSIGHAARLGHAMGLHQRDAPQMLPRSHTWTEQEEKRRVWWAVILLDRFSSIGHRGTPFATSDPSLDTHLPTDDSHWDRGQMLVAAPLALSATHTVHAGPFARTCQAAHLLGSILRHVNDKAMPAEYRSEEALQLHRTMRALATALPDEAGGDDIPHGPSLCSAMAICYSGLLTLYDAYSCTDRGKNETTETQLQMQKESIDGLREVTAQALQLARRVLAFVEQSGIGKLSPLVIDSLYQAAANYAWYVRESSDAECREHLRQIKEIMLLIDKRWRVAGQYLSTVVSFWEDLQYP